MAEEKERHPSDDQIESLRSGIEAEAKSLCFEVTAFETFDAGEIVVVQLKRTQVWED